MGKQGSEWGDQRPPGGREGAGPASFSSKSPVAAGSGRRPWLGVPKGGLVGKSFQLRTGNPGLGAGEMIPPEGQAWSRSGCLPGAQAPRCSRRGVLRSSMNHSFLNLSKCVYKIKLRPRPAPGGAGR